MFYFKNSYFRNNIKLGFGYERKDIWKPQEMYYGQSIASVGPLASTSPRPAIASRTALITAILFAPADTNTTSNSVCSSTTAAAAAGAWKGAGEAGAGFGTKFKMAASAGFKQTASAWDSGIKDHASRLLTGKESSSHNASSLHNGVGNIDEIQGGETLTPEQKTKAGHNGEVNNNVVSAIHQNQAKVEAQKIEAEKAKKKNSDRKSVV